MTKTDPDKLIPWNMRERMAFLAGFVGGLSFFLLVLAIPEMQAPTLALRVQCVFFFVVTMGCAIFTARTSMQLTEWDKAASSLRIINSSLKRPLPETASLEQIRDQAILELLELKQ